MRMSIFYLLAVLVCVCLTPAASSYVDCQKRDVDTPNDGERIISGLTPFMWWTVKCVLFYNSFEELIKKSKKLALQVAFFLSPSSWFKIPLQACSALQAFSTVSQCHTVRS